MSVSFEDPEEPVRSLLHECNGALFVIRGHAELVVDAGNADLQTRRHLSAIIEQCDLLAERLREFRKGDNPPS